MEYFEHLRQLRKIKGFSAKELGRVIGNVDESTILKYERGVMEPGIRKVIKIADALDVSIDELVGHQPPKHHD